MPLLQKSNQRIKTWEDIDKEGVVVAVAKGTYHVGLMQKPAKCQTPYRRILHAREQEVLAGRADVFMTDYPWHACGQRKRVGKTYLSNTIV